MARHVHIKTIMKRSPSQEPKVGGSSRRHGVRGTVWELSDSEGLQMSCEGAAEPSTQCYPRGGHLKLSHLRRFSFVKPFKARQREAQYLAVGELKTRSMVAG